MAVFGLSEQMATFVIALLIQVIPLFAIVFYMVWCKKRADDDAIMPQTTYGEDSSTKQSSFNLHNYQGFMRPQTTELRSTTTNFSQQSTYSYWDASSTYQSRSASRSAVGVPQQQRPRTSSTNLQNQNTSTYIIGDIQNELSIQKISENCAAFILLSATVASTGIFHYTDFASDCGSAVTYYRGRGIGEEERWSFFNASIFFILAYRFISTWFFYKARFPFKMCVRQFFDLELYFQVYTSMFYNRYTKAMVFIKRFESVFESFPQAVIALWYLLLTKGDKDVVVIVSFCLSIWSISSSLSWSDDAAFKPHDYYTSSLWWKRTLLRVCEVTSRLFVLAYCAVAFSPLFLMAILLFDFFGSWCIHLWDKYVHHFEWKFCPPAGCGWKRWCCCMIQTHNDYNEEIRTEDKDGHVIKQHVHKPFYFKSIDNVLMFLIAVPSFAKDKLFIYMYAIRISLCVVCAGVSISYKELSRDAGISETDQAWVLLTGFISIVAQIFLIYQIKDKVISEGGGDSIFKAARSNDIDRVLDDIQFGGIKMVGGKAQAAVNKQDGNLMKALHHASAGGHIFLVKHLADKMIDIAEEEKGKKLKEEEIREIVDCLDLFGNTPMNHAVIEGHEDALRVLLNFKADARGRSGYEGDTGKFLIHEAAERGHGRICENLVELARKTKTGEDVNRLDEHRDWSPLMFACSKAGPIIYPFRRKINKDDDDKHHGNDREKHVGKSYQCQQLMGLMIEIISCDTNQDIEEDRTIPNVVCMFHESHNIKERKKKKQIGLINGQRIVELISRKQDRKIKSKVFNIGEIGWKDVWEDANEESELNHKLFFETVNEKTDLICDIRPNMLGKEQSLMLEEEGIIINFVVMDRYVYCVRELLRMGADTEIKGKEGETAMGLALRSRNMPVVELLLNARLDMKWENKEDHSPSLSFLISEDEWRLAKLNTEQYKQMRDYMFSPKCPRLVDNFGYFLDIRKCAPAPNLLRQASKRTHYPSPVRTTRPGVPTSTIHSIRSDAPSSTIHSTSSTMRSDGMNKYQAALIDANPHASVQPNFAPNPMNASPAVPNKYESAIQSANPHHYSDTTSSYVDTSSKWNQALKKSAANNNPTTYST